ncbi:MAG: copper resistance protein CopA [Rheinheimera sp.]|uniref:copper resistance system multicopper oxidase n=1 Tax=Arsukibacterium sp. UBA3155 TaxID=1946058 RepID=UPI000C943C40|nr:copper resistance system multicopper oxidase [Arsukibacterium sp. UBA3155]MAD73727.1 copper resistance protein CopA [Rheinheimera sp.]|tara:strand:- start:10448 stop:12262 length:1815 start_codon:yes stop_codon:yes gene_type:complete
MNNTKQRQRRTFIKNLLYTAGGLALTSRMAAPWAKSQGYTNQSINENNLAMNFGDGVVSGVVIDLTIAKQAKRIAGGTSHLITLNGISPGPLLRLKEGQNVTINVTNQLKDSSSIHWHGFILPYTMDGVPGVAFPGIAPNSTFRYQFDVEQNGTYWYHSHSGLQEQLGHLGPVIIDPKDGDIGADREHIILLSDWTFEDPHDVFRHLKVAEGYYNYQQRTIEDTVSDIKKRGFINTLKERAMWAEMRMNPRDILDVTGSTYTYLMNGRDAATNWTALYKPNESVRLRLINGSAMTYFDFRIPGLEMVVVAADGQPVKPVTVEEIRIAVAETYDVIVRPKGTTTYTLYAESMDRSGYVRGTLATVLGVQASVPELREMPERGMAAMGMGGMSSMNSMPNMDSHGSTPPMNKHSTMSKMMDMSQSKKPLPIDSIDIKHDASGHGAGASMIASNPTSRLDEPGIGFENVQHKVLVYSDLVGAKSWPDEREPTQTIELHLTGNMERYMWSFDGLKFSEVKDPVHFKYGERIRLILVNDSMMNHPIHLHGMWMELENGNYPPPRKHTISLKPSEKVSLLISADAPGNWAFHCHLLYHMDAGMFRIVSVS